jgi:MFS family permease
LLAAGLALSAQVTALWHLIILYGVVMTVGANCLGLVVITPLISRHFVEKRGLVLSIVQAANGFGRAASVPVVQFLISTVGWRRSYLVLAALMAIVIVAPGPAAYDWTLGEAIGTPHFWLLFLIYLLTGLEAFFVSLHQLAFAADVGFEPLHAASFLGMGSFLSVAGARSSPAPSRTTSDGRSRRSSPTASRSSASSPRCSSRARIRSGYCGSTRASSVSRGARGGP